MSMQPQGSAGSTVAIVIPVFNGMPQLGACLESIEWTRDLPDVDVVVVDCGSTDGSREYVASEHPWVRLVFGHSDMWWAAATNYGCRYAVDELGAEILGLLNHDCRWTEAGFVALRKSYAEQPAIHCSRVLLPDGRLFFAGGRIAWSGRLMIRGYYEAQDPGYPAGRVDWSGGQGVLVPAWLWTALDGFDERALPHYHADADFCLRARRLEVPTLYCPASTVVNDKSSTGLGLAREGGTLGQLWQTLVARKSSANVRDAVRFYARHAGVRSVSALSHLYAVHVGSSILRIGRGWRARMRQRQRRVVESDRSGAGFSAARGSPLRSPPEGEAAAHAQRRSGDYLRILVVTDLWPSSEVPGRTPFVRQPYLAVARRGHCVEVILLRRHFPPARVMRSLLHPRRLPAVTRAWLREDCLAMPLQPPPVAVVPYTSPPRATSHDRWGRWAVWLAGRRLATLAAAANPDVVHGHFATPSGEVAVWLAERLAVPAVVSVHGADLDYTATFRSRGRRSVGAVLRSADAVIANSGPMADVAAGLRGTRSGVHVLWQGGDSVLAPGGSDVSRGSPVRVLSVGHISAMKGHDRAAAALARCRDRGADFMWTIVGRGSADEERALSDLLQRLDLHDRVTITNSLTNVQVLEEMGRSDVFVLLSTREPYGVVYAEALGAGMAVVGSSVAGAAIDFTAAGAPLAMVDPYATTAVADALMPLLTDRALLAEVKHASGAWAAANLGWERYAAHLERIYASLSRPS